jgi:hypothetical protein
MRRLVETTFVTLDGVISDAESGAAVRQGSRAPVCGARGKEHQVIDKGSSHTLLTRSFEPEAAHSWPKTVSCLRVPLPPVP